MSVILINFVLADTARVYRNEKDIGSFLPELLTKHALQRSDIFVTSKLCELIVHNFSGGILFTSLIWWSVFNLFISSSLTFPLLINILRCLSIFSNFFLSLSLAISIAACASLARNASLPITSLISGIMPIFFWAWIAFVGWLRNRPHSACFFFIASSIIFWMISESAIL